MINNFIAEKKENFEKKMLEKLNVGIDYIANDHTAIGFAYGAFSFYMSPTLMGLAGLAFVLKAEGTQPFIIGSSLGFVAAPAIAGAMTVIGQNLVTGAFIFAQFSPFVSLAAATATYIIYSAEKAEAAENSESSIFNEIIELSGLDSLVIE